MTHNYNLRSKKNATYVIEDTPQQKIENNVIFNNLDKRDDVIYGNFNDALCSNHFKEDLLDFISRWKDLLPNIKDKMIENVKKTDYEKDPYNYLQVNNQLFLEIKNHAIEYLENNKRLKYKCDYDSIKTLFKIYMFSEEITDLISNNSVKESNLIYAKQLKEKVRKSAIKQLKEQIFSC
jgi:hypothetical protein